jgi:DUF1680 family protein
LKVAPASKASSSFPVYLRVPWWTKRFVAKVGEQSYTGTAGQFLTIERAWRAGDVIAVDMDMTVQTLPGAPTYAQSIAIQRGPQVLALEEELNPGLASMDTAGPRTSDIRLRDARAALPATWLGKQAWAIDGAEEGELVLAPFADAKSYRVWLARPVR